MRTHPDPLPPHSFDILNFPAYYSSSVEMPDTQKKGCWQWDKNRWPLSEERWRGGFMFIVYYCMSLSACMSLPVCSFRFSFVLVCIFCCVSLIRDGVYHRWPHDGLCRFWSPESWQHWDEGSTATKRAYDYLNLERVGWDIYQNDNICFF